MKKLYIFAILAGVATSAYSQRSTVVDANRNLVPSVKSLSASKAAGDTLFFFDGSGFYVADPSDNNDFTLENTDFDGKTPAAAMGWPATGGESFVYSFYSTDPDDFIPGYDVDTAYYIAATSWFDPAGQADNWWSFGPVTIPASGADLSWYHRTTDATYSDGYKVFISTTGAVPYTDVEPTTDTPVFTKNDCTNCVNDTDWVQKNVNLDQYAGNRIYVHYYHNANDMFILGLDHMVITEGNANPSVKENAAVLGVRTFPNPATNMVNVVVNNAAANSTMHIADITGKVVETVTLGTVSGSLNYRYSTENLSGGMYFFTVTSGTESITTKVSVVK